MDTIKKIGAQFQSGSSDKQAMGETESSGGLLGKLNSAAGGGREAEKKEDMLDKGIDAFQEHVLKQGPQDNENAIEQAKDKAIAGQVRSQYKNFTGSDFPMGGKGGAQPPQ